MTGISGGNYANSYGNSYYAYPSAALSPEGFGDTSVNGTGRRTSPSECHTCENRKYQDGSDEMVSFKSAAHISPEASAGRVRAHEQEHVSNAYQKAAQKDGKVVSASVSLKTDICSECGSSFVSGGTTSTQIKYSNEANPYQQNRKAADAAAFIGQRLDLAV